MHMPRCTQLTVDLLRSIVDSIAAVQGQDDLWLCHPAVTAVCCVHDDFDDFICGQENAAATSTCVCLPACVSINTCACVRVEIRTRNRTTRKQRKIHTHRTGAAKSAGEGGGREASDRFGGWSHDFHLRRRRWPTSSAYFWLCLCLVCSTREQQVKSADFSSNRHRVGFSGAIHVAANLRAFTWAA